MSTNKPASPQPKAYQGQLRCYMCDSITARPESNLCAACERGTSPHRLPWGIG